MGGERNGKNRDTGSHGEKRTTSAAARWNGTPIGTGRSMDRHSRRQVGCRCRISSKQKKLPANLHERRGGKLDDIRSNGAKVFPFPVSLVVSLHASTVIASSCLATGGALPLRSLVSFYRYERRDGGPFPVPSPRPVFRCLACSTRQQPTRRLFRPCPAWRRRCPDACENRLRDRSRGRRADRRCRPR